MKNKENFLHLKEPSFRDQQEYFITVKLRGKVYLLIINPGIIEILLQQFSYENPSLTQHS